MTKKILKALAGEKQKVPPIWMMRQAGRYLPEYRETRARAGDFLSLCYNSELAAEVTLQPIQRYGFDASILFADILLLPQALGADLWFVTGEGPRLSTVQTQLDFENLRKPEEINETLNPVYETVKILSKELPSETTLIGFAGAPWTVATYMVAGRGAPDQAPAHILKNENPELFDNLINLLVDGTVEYLSHQINAGAEVIKIFDSWAGSLKENDFDIVLMDIHMPGISGSEATQKIREFNKELPIIALTAVTIDENLDEFFRVGFNEIIPKPFKPELFFEKIHDTLKLSEKYKTPTLP